jgi:hypothetical protein
MVKSCCCCYKTVLETYFYIFGYLTGSWLTLDTSECSMVILSKFPPFTGVRDGLLRHLLIIIFQALSRRVPRHLFVRLHVKGVDVATPSPLSQRDQNPCQLSKWKFRIGHTYIPNLYYCADSVDMGSLDPCLLSKWSLILALTQMMRWWNDGNSWYLGAQRIKSKLLQISTKNLRKCT